jgi:hypothetical protein
MRRSNGKEYKGVRIIQKPESDGEIFPKGACQRRGNSGQRKAKGRANANGHLGK